MSNDYDVALACEDLVVLARSGPTAPPVSVIDLLAHLSLAAAELRRLAVELGKASKQVAAMSVAAEVFAPEAPAAPAARVKCKHVFAVSMADGVERCAKCFAPKKANGRPKKTEAAVPAPLEMVTP